MDDKKASRILYQIPGLNFDDQSNYPELMNKMIDVGTAFAKTFKGYVK